MDVGCNKRGNWKEGLECNQYFIFPQLFSLELSLSTVVAAAFIVKAATKKDRTC